MRKRTKLQIAVVVLLILGGIALMAYPFISNYISETQNASVIETYTAETNAADAAETETLLQAAQQYNETLRTSSVQISDPFDAELSSDIESILSMENYYSLLSVDGSEIIGYIEIPVIDVLLPIYHGTSSEVLERGVGHLEGSSLPIGGESTHSVLTGHTGLSKAKLFTDLTQLVEGDSFTITVLGAKYTYQVDQIAIVEPSDTSLFAIEEGQDYCTLVTCYPYGVNTHRLLVRGTRIETVDAESSPATEAETTEDRTSGSQWMAEYRKALIISIGMIFAALIVILIIDRRTAKKKKPEPNTAVQDDWDWVTFDEVELSKLFDDPWEN